MNKILTQMFGENGQYAKDKEVVEALERVYNGVNSRQSKIELLSNFINNDTSFYYIVRMSDYTIVWVNDIIFKTFGPDVIGKKCYEVFHDKFEPCGFCTNNIILNNDHSTYQWIFYNEKIKRLFLIEDVMQVLDFGDVKQEYRFEKAIDITDIAENIKDVFKKFNL